MWLQQGIFSAPGVLCQEAWNTVTGNSKSAECVNVKRKRKLNNKRAINASTNFLICLLVPFKVTCEKSGGCGEPREWRFPPDFVSKFCLYWLWDCRVLTMARADNTWWRSGQNWLGFIIKTHLLMLTGHLVSSEIYFESLEKEKKIRDNSNSDFF